MEYLLHFLNFQLKIVVRFRFSSKNLNYLMTFVLIIVVCFRFGSRNLNYLMTYMLIVKRQRFSECLGVKISSEILRIRSSWLVNGWVV
jgi:hypothetical protein